jgi:hypothetical protein
MHALTAPLSGGVGNKKQDLQPLILPHGVFHSPRQRLERVAIGWDQIGAPGF